MLCSASVTPSPTRAGREGDVCAVWVAASDCARDAAVFLGRTDK